MTPQPSPLVPAPPLSGHRHAIACSSAAPSAPTTDNPDRLVVEALDLHRQGKLDDAEAIYRRALDSNPDHADSLQLLGALSLQRRHTQDAISLLRRAVAVRPDYPEALNNLATALHTQGEADEALTHWEKAVTVKPDYAQAYGNLAKALAEKGKAGLALACWQRAVALDPADVGVHGDFAAALRRANRFDEAVALYEHALALQPDHVDMHCGFAAALYSAGQSAAAIDRYQKALALAPDHVGVHLGIANALEAQGKTGDATLHYERALALSPDSAHLRFRLCTAQLPILYLDEGEIEGRRAAYRRRLEQLCADVDSGRAGGDLVAAVGSNQPFYLPYQGQNDRDLQKLYGALVCRIISDKYPTAPMPPPPAPGEKVRVGIVAGLFRHHTVWKLMIRGWLSQLDRDRFEIFCYHTSGDHDSQTDIAATQCDRFVRGPLPGDQWREEILADRPHILLYPDIGMDPVSGWIAAHRLAPVQCVTWGHPNTTGYPTIDYFLSSDLMEPPDGDEHYSERLVRLPNLSIYYEPLDLSLPQISRDQLGLRPSAVAYWCGQSLFKYLPQYDQVFARIAREVGDCQFVFIQSHSSDGMTARFRQRLERAFAVFGLDANKHCVFLPRIGLEQFVAVIGQCDVVLDSIGWSGGNSTLEGLAQDTPIVTLSGPLMRGRHTMAILRLMGVTETIASTVDQYIDIAARLGRDPAWRAVVRHQMSDSKHRVYCDSLAIGALEAFFDRAARGAAEPATPGPVETGQPLPDQARNVIAFDAPAEAGFTRWSEPAASRAGDPRIASHRIAASRDPRRATTAAADPSPSLEGGRRGPLPSHFSQRQGA